MRAAILLCVVLFFSTFNSFSREETESRDIIIVGYQIGGYSLLGLEIEARMTNLIGFNFGGGGLKFHTGPDKNSPPIWRKSF